MARCDWRPYYAIAFDKPPPFAIVFMRKATAVSALRSLRVLMAGLEGAQPIGIAAVIGNNPTVQRAIWELALKNGPYGQQFGRALRPLQRHLQHNDPCDDMPDDYVNYLWLQLAREQGDTFKVLTLKNKINGHYGKLGQLK